MNKIPLILFAGLLFLSACATRYKYLPELGELSDNPYGAYINVHLGTGNIVRGEFLALDRNMLTIGSLKSPDVYFVDTLDVSKYFIQFASSKNYMLPTVVALSHGLWMIFTVPVNAVFSVSANIADKKELRFYNEPFTWVAKYSRYPQGLPEDFEIMGFQD